MSGKEVYKVWAPFGKRWVDWVRPVPFVDIDVPKEIHEFIDYDIPVISYVSELNTNLAIFVDISGVDSIKEGIALANIGYRPIPIFNGTNEPVGAMATTNNQIIEPLLVWGASELVNMDIDETAPPVFLLDTNRLNRYKFDRSVFDNSWDIYPQDIPSAEYFKKCNIDTILVRGNALQRDLSEVLYKYQLSGIKILFTDGFSGIKEVKIKKPKKVEF
ncbi:MAG: hypothetical protein IJ475_01700 [Bacilli bacterium]|nr:hypothetical protein [Bacilli bacterium]